MDREKKKKLEDKGWKVGSAGEFLGMSDEELEAEYHKRKDALNAIKDFIINKHIV